MIFPTNSVSQFHYVPAAGAVEKMEVDGKVAFKIFADSTKSELIEATDFIAKENILNYRKVTAPDDVKYRKALLVKIKSSDLLVTGQEYVLTLNITDFSDEDITVKAVMAFGTATAKNFYLELAESLIKSAKVDTAPLFELYDAPAGTSADLVAANKLSVGYTTGESPVKTVIKVNKSQAALTNGFWIVEAAPDWKIATVPERLQGLTIGTSEILVNSQLTNDWLANTEFAPVTANMLKLVNTHNVADLEYFCKFEKGNKDGYGNWPNGIEPKLYIDPTNTAGYAVLNVHYAYVGPHADNQKSERDAIFVATSEAAFAGIEEALGIDE